MSVNELFSLYYKCYVFVICLSVVGDCRAKCEQNVNHIKKGLPHKTTAKCKYIHDLNNKVLLCQVKLDYISYRINIYNNL